MWLPRAHILAAALCVAVVCCAAVMPRLQPFVLCQHLGCWFFGCCVPDRSSMRRLATTWRPACAFQFRALPSFLVHAVRFEMVLRNAPSSLPLFLFFFFVGRRRMPFFFLLRRSSPPESMSTTGALGPGLVGASFFFFLLWRSRHPRGRLAACAAGIRLWASFLGFGPDAQSLRWLGGERASSSVYSTFSPEGIAAVPHPGHCFICWKGGYPTFRELPCMFWALHVSLGVLECEAATPADSVCLSFFFFSLKGLPALQEVAASGALHSSSESSSESDA